MDYSSLEIGDKVIFVKDHPSKTIEWELIRIGATYKFRSTIQFDLFIELKREKLKNNIKKIIKKQ